MPMSSHTNTASNEKLDTIQGPHIAVQLDPGPPEKGVKHKFPWKGGLWDAFRTFLLTDYFQAAVQLAIGTFIVSLFTFIPAIRFRQSCLSTILFVAAMLLVAKDAHVGSRLAGSAIILGSLSFGGLVAACAVWLTTNQLSEVVAQIISLARAPQTAYTTFLCIFVGLALLITTTLRVKGNLGVGIISNLGFGIMLIAGQFVWPARELWEYTFTSLLRIGLVASLGVFLAGLFVLPSLAGDDLRNKLSTILRDLGHVVSEGAGHLLLRKQDEPLALYRDSKEERSFKGRTARLLNLKTQEELEDVKEIEYFTQPGLDLRPEWTKQKGVLSLSELRPRLARCREIFGMSCLEPPFLRWWGVPYNAMRWPAVMNALDTLVMRIAALDSIIEGESPMMLDSEIKDALGVSLLPIFRLLFAQIAASCASAGLAVQADVTGKRTGQQLLFEPSWAVIEYELAGAMYTGMKQYWQRVTAEQKDFMRPSPEVRALMYMGTIGNSIMEAMAAFEKAVKTALHYEQADDYEKAAQPVLEAIRVLREAMASPDLPNVIKAPPTEPAPVHVMCDQDMDKDMTALQADIEHETMQTEKQPRRSLASFKRSMSMRPMQQASMLHFSPGRSKAEPKDASTPAAEKNGSLSRRSPGAVAIKAKDAVKDRFLRYFAWAIPLLKAMFAYDVVTIFTDLFTKDIPTRFSTPTKIWTAFRKDRWFQFGLKYYAASVIVLAILLALQANYPKTRSWNGLYIDITIVVVLSEKVDTTFQKGMMRIITTVIGAVLGYLVMLDTDVATNPYGLMAIVCCFAWLSGLMALGTLKYGIFLTLITFDGLILCQYTGKHAGTVKSLYTRLVVTVWGVLICLGFDLLFPWYAASSATQALGSSFEAAGEILEYFLEVLSEELELGFLKGKEMDAALKERDRGLLRLEKGILQKRIAGPLGGVQISLEKEGVLWKRGVLAMPLIVRQVIQLLQAVLDRLAAVELMLLQKPIVSGRYSGAPWHYLHEPLHPVSLELGRATRQLCAATCKMMGEFPTPEDVQLLEVAVKDMHQSRLKWRAAFREQISIYFRLLRPANDPPPPLIAERSVDDGIRYQSSVFAMSKALDKIMLLARTVLEDPWLQQRAQHPHTWSTFRTWTGNYGY